MAEMPLFERLENEDHDEQERVFRVSEVNRAVRFHLEDEWGSVLIEGELSDVKRSQQGHVYFSLNDEEDPAQLRGVMFRSDVGRSKAPLQDGARVRFRGKLSLYQARGQFQLIARSAKLAGEGDLAAQFRKTRAKLEAEGLLDPSRRRPLPALPRVVGVVTSRTGAALRDIMRVAAERCPVHILVADCRVQGDTAPASIVKALQLVQRVERLDVVIVSRGGGSAEDLWAFNDEAVARAIAACRVPIVSGVGHEVDVTIADLVADLRAATPSNAAEIVVPERQALLRQLESMERRLVQELDNRLGGKRLRLERLLRALYGARRVIVPVRRELRALDEQLAQTARARLQAERRAHGELRQRLMRLDPRSVLRRDQRQLAALSARLRDAGRRPVAQRHEELVALRVALRGHARPMVRRKRAAYAELATHLDALSPLKVLDRGYAIALHAETGRAVRSRTEVKDGERLRVRVADGEFGAKVEEHE
jgi:exodeoxyribonuclease VII large subunit